MMRFRKRWLAKINIAFTNRITSLFAGWLPGFGILTHVGRKWEGLPNPSERFPRVERLHHRADVQQPKRMGEEHPRGRGCELKTRGKKYQLSSQRSYVTLSRRFPFPVRIVLKVVGADEYIELSGPIPR